MVLVDAAAGIEAVQPMGAQALPELLFGRRHLLAQFLSLLLDGGCDSDATNHARRYNNLVNSSTQDQPAG